MTRIISIGYGGMESLTKLDRSNCKKNAIRLIEKLSIEPIGAYDKATSTGTTYRIYHYEEIKRRRLAAGMVWVIRTSGVRFVDPQGNELDRRLGHLPSGAMCDLPGGPLGEVPPGPPGKSHTPPLGKTHSPYIEPIESKTHSTSSAVLAALRKHCGHPDQEALDRLVQDCRLAAPDCTGEEMVHFIDAKARVIKQSGGRITNALGFLLMTVPKCFVGESFREYRRQRDAEKERAAAEAREQQLEVERQTQELHRQLEDPNVPEEEKAWIRKCLL